MYPEVYLYPEALNKSIKKNHDDLAVYIFFKVISVISGHGQLCAMKCCLDLNSWFSNPQSMAEIPNRSIHPAYCDFQWNNCPM